MKLTLSNRLKLCFEIITARSGHAHTAQEKILPIFLRGYAAGKKDAEIKHNESIGRIKNACAEKAEECVYQLHGADLVNNIKRAVLHAVISD